MTAKGMFFGHDSSKSLGREQMHVTIAHEDVFLGSFACDRQSLVFLVLVTAEHNGKSHVVSLLGPYPACAVVAGQLFQPHALHAADDVHKLGIPVLEGGDMQAAVGSVGLEAFDVALSPLEHIENAHMAAAGHTEDALVLDVEVEVLFAAHAVHDGQIVHLHQNAVEELVGLIRAKLDTLALGGNVVFHHGDVVLVLAIHEELALGIKCIGEDDRDVLITFENRLQAPVVVVVLVGDDKNVDFLVFKHLVNAHLVEAVVSPFLGPAGIHQDVVHGAVELFDLDESSVTADIALRPGVSVARDHGAACALNVVQHDGWIEPGSFGNTGDLDGLTCAELNLFCRSGIALLDQGTKAHASCEKASNKRIFYEIIGKS